MMRRLQIFDAALSPYCPYVRPLTSAWPFAPLLWLCLSDLLARTDSASMLRTSTVDSQLMHASVMLTPFLRADGPSAGTFWFPSWMFDSIITPTIAVSPSRIWSAMTLATLG